MKSELDNITKFDLVKRLNHRMKIHNTEKKDSKYTLEMINGDYIKINISPFMIRETSSYNIDRYAILYKKLNDAIYEFDYDCAIEEKSYIEEIERKLKNIL